MRIALGDIYIGPRIRKDYGKQEMEDLKQSMDENGQITAITVRPPNLEERTQDDYDGQPWVLVAGGRRTKAAMLLGWDDIEGYAREEMEELTHRLLELHENLHRKAMTWQEEVDAKAEIVRLRRIENPEITNAQIAKELGETPANLSRDLKTAAMVQANPDLKRSTSKSQALNTGTIMVDHQQRMQRMANAEPSQFLGISEAIHTAKAEDYVLNLPENSVDLFLCDGPYGINYWDVRQVSSNSDQESLAEYDDRPSVIFPMYESILPDMVRAARETGWIFFFCSTQLERHLRQLCGRCCRTHGNYFIEGKQRCEVDSPECTPLVPEEIPWLWYKPNAGKGSRFPHLHAANKYELILPINMGKARLMYTCENVLPFEVNYGKDDRVHGVQRPVELLQELVKRTTYPGDMVVDLFYGSGSGLAAAASLGRRFAGSDQNPALRELAIGLITKHYKPVMQSEIKASEDRYQRAISGEALDPVRPVARGKGLSYNFEVYRVGSRMLGYIKYDGHNMAQLSEDGSDQDAFEFRLQEACDYLDMLNTIGKLDADSCSPEEAQIALNEWKESQ